MLCKEITESVGGTCSGSVATVSMPLGSMQRRAMPADSFFGGVAVSDADPTPNTPDYMKKKKRKK